MPGLPDPLRISVVIPCFNRQGTIVRAIESALAQRERPCEVIVVDDGSTDRTGELVRGLGGSVRYVHQPNGGASSARNHGVRLAVGDWIAFLDSDDRWYPEHLARIGAAIRGTGGRAALYFADLRDEDGGSVWTAARFAIAGEFEYVEDAAPWAILPVQPMMLQASVVRRADYARVGGLWEALRVREDTHFYLRFCTGRPACAVAGCAGEMMGDVDRSQRLSKALGPQSDAFWSATVALYEDILRHVPALAPAARRELARRLADGHMRLARAALEARDWPHVLAHLARAGRRDPRRLAVAILRRVRPSGRAETVP